MLVLAKETLVCLSFPHSTLQPKLVELCIQLLLSEYTWRCQRAQKKQDFDPGHKKSGCLRTLHIAMHLKQPHIRQPYGSYSTLSTGTETNNIRVLAVVCTEVTEMHRCRQPASDRAYATLKRYVLNTWDGGKPENTSIG